MFVEQQEFVFQGLHCEMEITGPWPSTDRIFHMQPCTLRVLDCLAIAILAVKLAVEAQKRQLAQWVRAHWLLLQKTRVWFLVSMSQLHLNQVPGDSTPSSGFLSTRHPGAHKYVQVKQAYT